jgi:hypothetical protein
MRSFMFVKQHWNVLMGFIWSFIFGFLELLVWQALCYFSTPFGTVFSNKNGVHVRGKVAVELALHFPEV